MPDLGFWEFIGIALAALVMIPVFFGGGFVIGAALALGILLVFYGIPRLISYFEARHMGAGAAKITGNRENTAADAKDSRWRRKN